MTMGNWFKYTVYVVCIAIAAWTMWADRYSEGARACFARGGNHFDSWGWTCNRWEQL